MKKDFSKIIEKIPHQPGVYQFLNEEKDPLYIGKAKDLRKRLGSYFRKSAKHSPRIQKMLENFKDVKWTETNSEIEALILEDNLVKQYQPKYNVLLRDDKTFQYIKVSVQNDYPEIYTVRKIIKDGAKYFGPKTSGSDVKKLMESIKRIFKLCSVKNITVDPKTKPLIGAKVAVKVGGSIAKRPCLDYHIKRCLGPCAGIVTPEEYRQQINKAIEFLKGDYKPAIETLKAQMIDFAAAKKFERAARLRDQIGAIERSAEKQLITDTHIIDRDVIGCVEDLGKFYLNLFQIRNGRLIGQDNFIVENGETPAEAMETFIRDYYAIAADIPKEILISIELNHKKLLQDYVRQFCEKAVNLIYPQAGHKDHLVLLSEKNARSFAEQNRARWMADKREEKALEELQKKLKLPKLPNRIECYDISHLSGTETVGSMVVFKRGSSSSADYRQFRLKSTQGKIDDFKSMNEVLMRRLNYLPEKPPSEYEIKKATKKHQEKLVKITKDKKIEPKDFYLLLHNEEIIGTGRIKMINEKISRIANLWIHPDHHGKKLGYFLMKKLIENSKEKRIYLMCHQGLKEYYEKFGFQIINQAAKELKAEVKKNKLKEVIFMAFQKKKKDLSFKAKPDLIVIDGGKGQLSSAFEALQVKNFEIPIIALAKKLEEVFIPNQSQPLPIPNNTEASYLLQRIRDEAHRFAISHNRSSRNKKMVKSALDEVSGIGPKNKKRLLTYFGSVDKIKRASLDTLSQVVGDKLAKSLKEKL